MNNFDSLDLIRFIGHSHSDNRSEELNETTLINLVPLAIENKVALLFLERALNRYENSATLNNIYSTYLKKLQSRSSLVTEICEVLANSKIKYVIFKTFKPFPSLTVDVDILFFTRDNLMQACHLLKNHGCNLAGYGAHSITMYSPKHVMNVDLHSEIAVSRMVYINSNLLEEYVTEHEIDGCQVPVFENAIALAMVLSHSLYKEQVFTIADYYTTIDYLLNSTQKQQRILADFAEKTHIEYSIKTALMIVNALTIKAFGKNNSTIDDIIKMVHTNEIEDQSTRLSIHHFERNIQLPYKYDLSTVATAFLVKLLSDPLMRGTLTHQFVEVIFGKSNFWKSVLPHFRRETN